MNDPKETDTPQKAVASDALLALREQYPDGKHIEEIREGERGFGKYKYRVIGRSGFPNHHTNDIEDARQWLDKCRLSWANGGGQSPSPEE